MGYSKENYQALLEQILLEQILLEQILLEQILSQAPEATEKVISILDYLPENKREEILNYARHLYDQV